MTDDNINPRSGDAPKQPSSAFAQQPEPTEYPAQHKDLQISAFQKLLKAAGSIPKTMMDTDACRQIANSLNARMSSNAAQDKTFRSAPSELAPDRKRIDKFKNATPCPTSWEKMTGAHKVRYCEECGLQAYDFESMNDKEAHDLVFQRENRTGVTLYKRVDGKFLTKDCPVGVKKRRTTTAVLALLGIAGIGFFTLAITQATQQPTPVVEIPTTTMGRPRSSSAQGPLSPADSKWQNSLAVQKERVLERQKMLLGEKTGTDQARNENNIAWQKAIAEQRQKLAKHMAK